jgi:RecA/RadA recombinase
MTNLRDKLIKNSVSPYAAPLGKGPTFTDGRVSPTNVPMINVGLSGSLKGGLIAGTTMIAGPSKHFKTTFTLFLASQFLKNHPDGTVIYYDNEFGEKKMERFALFGLTEENTVHIPITNIEMLTHDLMIKLDGAENDSGKKTSEGLTRDDKVMIIIDSVGNIASVREIKNSLKQNEAQDMTRAKALKAFFRQVTVNLNLKDIPMVVINHTYQDQSGKGTQVVSGGTGGVYNADNIWVIGRQQIKDGKVQTGFNFTIRMEKSRFLKEGSKIDIEVLTEGGLNRWSGLFDLAIAAGFINQNGGWYADIDPETGEVTGKFRRAERENDAEYFKKLIDNERFQRYVSETFCYSNDVVKQDEVK